MTEVVLFASPVSVGHTRVLIPLARRLVQRGVGVVWAMSGDVDEPASAWREPLERLGVEFIDLDAVVRFDRPDLSGKGFSFATLQRRIVARAADVTPAATAAFRTAVGGRRVIAAVHDFFALWASAAFLLLGVRRRYAVVSAFPSALAAADLGGPVDDPIYLGELERLRRAGVPHLDGGLRPGFLLNDPELGVLGFSSAALCPDAPPWVRLLGVHVDALPAVEDLPAAPEGERALVERLQEARGRGTPVLLLSLGTIIIRMLHRVDPVHRVFHRRLYGCLAAAALRQGAIVVASTSDASPADLGVDEASLGGAARERVVALPFVPQPRLFAHGLVDAMLTHGGANTFHETVVSGVPLVVAPAFGDQEAVARSVLALGLGAVVQTPTFPDLPGCQTMEQIAEEVLPSLLQGGRSPYKATAAALAERVRGERGLDAAEATLLAER